MADAKIMTFGELFSPTTDVIPDDRAAAVEIEGLDGNDYIKIDTTDGEEAVRLVGSGTGKVGVGPTAPLDQLHVSSLADTGTHVKFTHAGTGHTVNDGGYIGMQNGANGMRVYNREASPIAFGTSNAEAMRIAADGDVGIKITDPSANLHVTKGSGTPTSLAEVDTQSIVKIQARTDNLDTLHFCNNSAMILQGSDGADNSTTPKNISLQPFGGDVGIGTTAPGAKLDVDGAVRLLSSLNVANTAVLGTDAVAIGDGATAAGANAFSVGFGAIAGNTKSVAIGTGANASGSGSMAIGPSCQGAANNSVAIGTNSARTEGAFSMAIGYFSLTKRPYEQTFSSATYGVDKKASSQRKFVSGQCQTTDDTVTTMLDAENAGSTAMLVNTTNCQTTDKSSTTFFRVRVISTVTGGDEDSDFEIGEFLARSYTFAIKWVYDVSTPTISMISDSAGTAIASDATIYAARENVRASNAVISHATNGIVDSITLVADPGDQPGRGAWKFRVQSANDGATIRHSCFVDQVDHILA